MISVRIRVILSEDKKGDEGDDKWRREGDNKVICSK